MDWSNSTIILHWEYLVKYVKIVIMEELLIEFREEADFINALYGLGDLDHDTALDRGHIYELMRKFSRRTN